MENVCRAGAGGAPIHAFPLDRKVARAFKNALRRTRWYAVVRTMWPAKVQWRWQSGSGTRPDDRAWQGRGGAGAGRGRGARW